MYVVDETHNYFNAKKHMTDQELQIELAKRLPNVIKTFKPLTQEKAWYEWNNSNYALRESEWLHVCHLIEQKMTITLPEPPHKDSQRTRYVNLLDEECGNKGMVMATWQQRAQAIIKVMPL